MQAIGHWINFYLLLPVVSRMPTAWWAFACRIISLPLGAVQWIRRRDLQRRYLEAIGLPAGECHAIGFSIESAYLKLRHLEFYFYRTVPHVREVWEGPPPTVPTMFVTLNTYGLEGVAPWLDRHAGLVVRRQWDDEPNADPSTASLVDKWRSHQAATRIKSAGHREIVVGASPMSYRKVRNVDRHLIIFQDVWDESLPRGKVRRMFGRSTPLPLGGLRLAKMAGDLPVRMLFIEPKGGEWIFRAGPPIKADAEPLIEQMEAEIRRRPAAWMLWTQWMEYQLKSSPDSGRLMPEPGGLLAEDEPISMASE